MPVDQDKRKQLKATMLTLDSIVSIYDKNNIQLIELFIPWEIFDSIYTVFSVKLNSNNVPYFLYRNVRMTRCVDIEWEKVKSKCVLLGGKNDKK